MAAKFLFDGGNGALISMQNNHFVPMYFKDILDPKTHKMRIRMVDIESESYRIANRYMIRFKKDDFEDPHEMAKYAATANISLKEFEKQFGYLLSDEAKHIPAPSKSEAKTTKK